ncbi:MAG: DUF5681 domain-containing protein [Beijerinckiaceae bacterium]
MGRSGKPPGTPGKKDDLSMKGDGEPPSRDYEVGYGRPPKASRFKPGQSGNRKGRPKGSLSMSTLVGRELDRKVTVRIGGKLRTMTNREVNAVQLVQKSRQDTRMLKFLLEIDPATKAEKNSGAASPVGFEGIDAIKDVADYYARARAGEHEENSDD